MCCHESRGRILHNQFSSTHSGPAAPVSDNPGEKQTRPLVVKVVKNSNCFLFQPPEPSSVDHHSHYSQIHHPSFLTPSDTTWPQFWVCTNVHYYTHVLKRSIRFLCEVLEMWFCDPKVFSAREHAQLHRLWFLLRSIVHFLRPYWFTNL